MGVHSGKYTHFNKEHLKRRLWICSIVLQLGGDFNFNAHAYGHAGTETYNSKFQMKDDINDK